MKVKITSYQAVAAWRWDMPEDDDVCGICRVQYDGTCPKCKFPGDDCPISQSEGNTPAIPHIPVWDHPRYQDDIDITDALDEPSYPDAPLDELLPPPDFRPFFTLIEDPESGEHIHPAVHYIFSDDDPDFVTSAILEGLESEQQDQIKGGDGKTIKNVQSLSPEWQVSNAVIGQAPSWSEDSSRKATAGSLLQIEGTETRRKTAQPERRQSSQDDVTSRVESAIAGYEDRLYALEKLVRKDIVERDHEPEEQDETNTVTESA
ncbi:hypothetical protein MBLNU459_g4112t1 [Dothideomycetes sp. NU459]